MIIGSRARYVANHFTATVAARVTDQERSVEVLFGIIPSINLTQIQLVATLLVSGVPRSLDFRSNKFSEELTLTTKVLRS